MRGENRERKKRRRGEKSRKRRRENKVYMKSGRCSIIL